MKCTGVIRRIDELGRIVIPKEIRKSLAIREGESLEIFIDNDKLIMKKYSKLDNYQNDIKDIIKYISNAFNININFYDRDKLIVSSDEDFKNIEFLKEFNNILKDRKDIILNDVKIDENNYKIYCKPIILLSDVIGILVINIKDNLDEVIKIANFLSNIIIKKLDIS
jgi:stage V sporulation protein T